MLKRLLSIVLALSLVLGITTLPLEASQAKTNVKLNGIDLELEDEIYINEEGKIKELFHEYFKKTWNNSFIFNKFYI